MVWESAPEAEAAAAAGSGADQVQAVSWSWQRLPQALEPHELDACRPCRYCVDEEQAGSSSRGRIMIRETS